MTCHLRLVASLVVCIDAGTSSSSFGAPNGPHRVALEFGSHGFAGGVVTSSHGVKRANGSLLASDGFGQRSDERPWQSPSPSGCWIVVCRRTGLLARLSAATTWRASSAWSGWPSNDACVYTSAGLTTD